ncbi:nitroreductase [Marinobacterium nitratireducens]|uniref:Nitroreductase n=1 Tax=Marinobacterium nitratireducens TaxID=518897 RepID=A0A918DVN9_9GAMM|nr:NAD(P)H-dependent oxidoreductase [Marinobacterium nitratireducens]GGO84600.1 nitroreductase [Marinobacterium nitratireducens]
MNIVEALNWRYAAKRMNGRKVPHEKVERILEAARLAPSSYGLQTYSILVIEDPALREKIRVLAYDQPQITESSHLLVFAAWENINETHVDDFIRMTAAARGLKLTELEGYRQAINGTVNGFASSDEQLHWAARQAYISLGTALTAAATEQVDASPMEGFDAAGLDDLLSLREQGLRSVVLLALGYRDTGSDRQAGMTKVRWPRERMFIHL